MLSESKNLFNIDDEIVGTILEEIVDFISELRIPNQGITDKINLAINQYDFVPRIKFLYKKCALSRGLSGDMGLSHERINNIFEQAKKSIINYFIEDVRAERKVEKAKKIMEQSIPATSLLNVITPRHLKGDSKMKAKLVKTGQHKGKVYVESRKKMMKVKGLCPNSLVVTAERYGKGHLLSCKSPDADLSKVLKKLEKEE